MSMLHPNPLPHPEHLIAGITSVTAEGRLHTSAESKARAFVDVTLYMQPGGTLTVHGCTVLHETACEPTVLMPGRKGDRRYFPVVSVSGEIRRVIENAILTEYRRLQSGSE
jgi:DNA-binding cell septation regulator SpoVG